MSLRKKLIKIVRILLKQIKKLSIAVVKNLMNWILRSLMVMTKQAKLSKSGFVLPTAVMMLVMVTLLVTALVLRSFDRSKNISNSRIEQIVQNSSTPAIERARAKLDALLNDPNSGVGTPSDDKLIAAMLDAKYTFGDETRLKLVYDFGDGQGSFTKDGIIQYVGGPTTGSRKAIRLSFDESLNTIWKYPIDTDGNGLFDSFTIYGMFWRNPGRTTSGTITQFERPRNPLESRSLPQESSGIPAQCKAAGTTSSTTVGNQDWFKTGSSVSKAFYVYAATVPITDLTELTVSNKIGPFASTAFEVYSKGLKSFAGVEYEQDRYKIGLNNNSVWYQDDLILTPGPAFNMNGRITTNGNLLIGGHGGAIRLYQVSSQYSCFYQPENSAILVGGNVGTGNISDSTDQTAVTVDLYKGFGQTVGTGTINGSNRSTTSAGGYQVAYNDAAYRQRLNLIVQATLNLCKINTTTTCSPANPPTVAIINGTTTYPTDLKNSFAFDTDPTHNTSNRNTFDILSDEIKIYYSNRLRRVPFKEVAAIDGTGATTGFTLSTDFVTSPNGYLDPVDSVRKIDAPQAWRDPTDANTGLTITRTNLQQTEPYKQQQLGKQQYLGDRVLVGNNLPSLWRYTTLPTGSTTATTTAYVGQKNEKQYYKDFYTGDSTAWTDSTPARYRTTQMQAVSDLGVSDRNGYWEGAAAQDPADPAKNNAGGGGLRIITGAGIYVDDDGNSSTGSFPRATYSFLLNPILESTAPTPTSFTPFNGSAQSNILVWSDLMPMTGGSGETRKGDLQMRATAVYHYVDDNTPTVAPTTTNPNSSITTAPKLGVAQLPIACVSSYYDPSFNIDLNGNSTVDNGEDTTNNLSGLPWDNSPSGNSNNGIVYPFPFSGANYRTDSTKLTTALKTILNRQARLVFPNGRIANPRLRDALAKDPTTWSYADNSAIDTAICALSILGQGGLTAATPFTTANSPIPHGAIKEATFLNARELKALDRTIDPSRISDARRISDPVTNLNELFRTPNSTTAAGTDDYKTNNTSTGTGAIPLDSNYDLPMEQRQPLEIRVTDIDMEKLAQTTHGTYDSNADGTAEQEYLLPNSGIIYASREDALDDRSDPSEQAAPQTAGTVLSPTDFRLDPTRRPNAIRLINGVRLARGTDVTSNDYRVEEKGLILVTNLPAYVKGHFNLHLSPGITAVAPLTGTSTIYDPTSTSQVQIEEFSTVLDSTWSNFYTRGNASGGGLDARFACRKGQAKCTNSSGSATGTSVGDQWRPAQVIADSITLQSYNFKTSTGFVDGYRNYADFDINNNGGNAQVTTRKTTDDVINQRFTNGFFDNAYVPSNLWYNTTVNWTTNVVTASSSNNNPIADSSYLSNSVTPVQVRQDNFPEYLMEVCTKLPVELCGPDDWYVNPATSLRATSAIGQSFVPANHPAGTTAIPAAPQYQRYPRRVAFRRQLVNGTLNASLFIEQYSTTNNYPVPQPIGINAATTPVIDSFSYKATTGFPKGALGTNIRTTNKNALLFTTTSNTTGNPTTSYTYSSSNPLGFYANTLFLSATTPNFAGVNLNSPSTAPVAAYTICAKNGKSADLRTIPQSLTVSFTTSTTSICDTTVIPNAITTLTGITPSLYSLATTNNVYPIQTINVQPSPTVTLPATATFPIGPGSTTTFTDPTLSGWTPPKSGPVVNFINIPTPVAGTPTIVQTNGTCTIINLVGNSNSIFVFTHTGSDLKFGTGLLTTDCGVQVQLTGVNPNNVFWVTDSNFSWNTVSSTAGKGHIFVGNFLSSGSGTVTPVMNTTTFPLGVRLLQPNVNNYATASNLSPIAYDGQPMLRPVLNVNNGISNGSTALSNLGVGNWKQSASGTINYNFGIVAGNSPPRPQEEDSGLHNYPRFLETWSATANIRGSFIQQKRSQFSTGPFSSVTKTTSNAFSNSLLGYTASQYDNNGQILYQYYSPPTRQWGFDVGLLSQTPDLFSSRFTQDITKRQNYYRTIGRDDTWIQSLLCAAEPPDPNTTIGTTTARTGVQTTTYTRYAVNSSERPTCSSLTGVSLSSSTTASNTPIPPN